MNANNIALRDPAYAAIMGQNFASRGPHSNFGAEASFGSDFGMFSEELDEDDDDDDDFGEDDMGAPRRHHPMHLRHPPRHPVHHGPSHAQLVRLWHRHSQNMMHKDRRERLMNPNKGSDVKIERYSFPISDTFVMGTAKTFTGLSNSPDVRIRPQRVTTNAPAPMFVLISDLKVANVSVIVGGSAVEDAFDYASVAFNTHLDIPTIEPSNKATVVANYTGFTPPGFVPGTTNTFVVALKGPAEMVG